MKIASLVLYLLMLSSDYISAKPLHRLSVGMGSGYIEYNPKKTQFFYGTQRTRWNQTVLYTTDTKFSFLNPYVVAKGNTKGYSLPVLYGSFQVAKDFTLRVSYQRSQFQNDQLIPKSSYYLPSGFWCIPETIYNLSYRYSFNDYHLGFSFTFNPRNRIKAYAGADVTMLRYAYNANFQHETVVQNHLELTGEQVYFKERRYGANHFFGLQYPFSERVHVQYECSGYLTDAGNYYIRPVSRLSLDLNF